MVNIDPDKINKRYYNCRVLYPCEVEGGRGEVATRPSE